MSRAGKFQAGFHTGLDFLLHFLVKQKVETNSTANTEIASR
jgi:hypothetical protein